MVQMDLFCNPKLRDCSLQFQVLSDLHKDYR